MYCGLPHNQKSLYACTSVPKRCPAALTSHEPRLTDMHTESRLLPLQLCRPYKADHLQRNMWSVYSFLQILMHICRPGKLQVNVPTCKASPRLKLMFRKQSWLSLWMWRIWPSWAAARWCAPTTLHAQLCQKLNWSCCPTLPSLHRYCSSFTVTRRLMHVYM